MDEVQKRVKRLGEIAKMISGITVELMSIAAFLSGYIDVKEKEAIDSVDG